MVRNRYRFRQVDSPIDNFPLTVHICQVYSIYLVTTIFYLCGIYLD
jgi:hypothetical protein